MSEPPTLWVILPSGQCAYFPSWGFPRCLVVRRVALPADWDARIERLAHAGST